MMDGEQGFTLIELLIAITIGLLVIGTGITVLVAATRQSDAAQRRTDGTQRATVAMDAVTRELRSQTCYRATGYPVGPLVAGSDTSVTFYVDFATTSGATAPQRRQLTLDTATDTLRETRWVTGAGQPDPTGTGTAVTRVLARAIDVPSTGKLFTYYEFGATSKVADAPLPAPLSAADLPTVARIGVTLVGNPTGITDGTRATPLDGDVFVRLTDPDGSVVPLCA